MEEVTRERFLKLLKEYLLNAKHFTAIVDVMMFISQAERIYNFNITREEFLSLLKEAEEKNYYLTPEYIREFYRMHGIDIKE
ncbi:MAG: hypothetical protein ACPLW7_06890 [Minisyncoccia bacterium]|jgi:hypothetical protein